MTDLNLTYYYVEGGTEAVDISLSQAPLFGMACGFLSTRKQFTLHIGHNRDTGERGTSIWGAYGTMFDNEFPGERDDPEDGFCDVCGIWYTKDDPCLSH